MLESNISTKLESDAQSFVLINKPERESEFPNFFKTFKEIIINQNSNPYYCLAEDIESIKAPFTYNLTYFSLPKKFIRLDKDLNEVGGKIENNSHIVFPIVVNINQAEWIHPCDINKGQEKAGKFNCAMPVSINTALAFKVDIEASPLSEPFNYLVPFFGNYYIIPLLSSKLEQIFIATKDKKAVEKYNEDLKKVLEIPNLQEFFIAVDSFPVAIDGWNASVSFFNVENNELKGVRFVPVLS